MAHEEQEKRCPESRHLQRRADFEELVRIIGYQLTAFVGSTDLRTVARWLQEGVPDVVQPRMEAALDIAKPIERVESELVAQGFLVGEMCGIAPYCCAAEMLRAADVRITKL
jgi:hypothetical protein